MSLTWPEDFTRFSSPLKTVEKTTTGVMPFGKFMFNVMPFGLRNAPVTFQRLMDDVLRDCTNFAPAYIDDVAIFIMTWTEHLHHLRTVLGVLQEEGLTIQPQKTQLATHRLANFLVAL